MLTVDGGAVFDVTDDRLVVERFKRLWHLLMVEREARQSDKEIVDFDKLTMEESAMLYVTTDDITKHLPDIDHVAPQEMAENMVSFATIAFKAACANARRQMQLAGGE